jgi:hypothetical protein
MAPELALPRMKLRRLRRAARVDLKVELAEALYPMSSGAMLLAGRLIRFFMDSLIR